MMRSTLLFAALLACPLVASAGTCEAPTPALTSNSTPSGSTCGGTAGINMGGTVYPHPSQVFSFHKSAGATNIAVAGGNREMSVVASCMSAGQGPAPLVVGFPGGPADISGLADGDYVLVVSTDPSIAVTNPPQCGNYDLTVGTLPVTLQKFDVN